MNDPKSEQKSPNVYGANPPEGEGHDRKDESSVADILESRRDDVETGGMGREGTPKDPEASQGRWENEHATPVNEEGTDEVPS